MMTALLMMATLLNPASAQARLTMPHERVVVVERVAHRPATRVVVHRPVRAPALDFHDALRIVRSSPFDSDKRAAIAHVAHRGRFTTEQARRLAMELAFDSSRVEALILLYPAVVDPHRYALTLDVLAFSSSRREVARALRL